MAKATTKLNAEDRVILFCAATGIDHAAVGILARAMQSMAVRGYIESMIRRAGRMCSRTAAALCSGGILSRLSSILHRNKPRRSLAPACGRGFFRNIRHARSFSTVSDRTSGRHAVSIRMVPRKGGRMPSPRWDRSRSRR